MAFPGLIDIATKPVLTIDEEQRLDKAVAEMYQHNHRDIIVTREESHDYRLITANDLVRFKKEGVAFDTPVKELKIDKVSILRYDASLTDAFHELQTSHDYLCIIDESDSLCGIVTLSDVIGSMDPAELIKIQKIKDILSEKVIKQTAEETSTFDVLQMMSHDIHDSVIICNKNIATGIITTKDTIRLLHDKADLSRAVRDYMSSPVQTIDEETTIQDALDFIEAEHFKRVVVGNKEGEVVGYISKKELLARVYSRWAEGLKSHGKALEEINKTLEARASKFKTMAQVDALTGLTNRAAFEERMLDEIERTQRYSSESFSLIFFDIDHFKRINDTFGHLVGDKVLSSLSAQCSTLLRTNDTFARWGGEEFVAILPMTNSEQAQRVAEKLRHHIEAYIFEQVGHITCSFGVTQYRRDDTLPALLHRTDSAMYEAKQSGRNRVVTA